MKITLVGYTTPQSGIPGTSRGIARYIYNLGRKLIELGHEIELFVRNDYEPKEEWIKTVYSPKITWVIYPIFLFPRIALNRADIYHSDYVTTGTPLIFGRKQPAIVSIHDVIPFTYRKEELTTRDKIIWKWYMLCFKIIQYADAIIVLSNYAKREALKYTKIPEEKIHVTYLGVNTKHFFPLRKIPREKIRIGYLGGLGARKNFILLLKSFQKINQGYDNVELHVAGGTRNEVEKFRGMKIPNTYFYGSISENKINKFLNSLDSFAYPTLYEGFGLPVVEAMACGLPVVACNTCTMPEIVGDAGILVEPNEDSMSNGIIKLIEDEKLRKKMSKKSLERAKEFTWEKCAKETLKVYENVLRY